MYTTQISNELRTHTRKDWKLQVTAPNTGRLLKYARLMRETRTFLERSCKGHKKSE